MESLLSMPLHRLVTLWIITRTDGTILRFTDHNSDISLLDDTAPFTKRVYSPVGGFDASAKQRLSGLRSRNFEARGIIDAAVITDEDIRKGFYNDAKIQERVVDWKYPWAGFAVNNIYWIHELTWDGFQWRAQLAGASRWLREPVGGTYNRVCDRDLGDDDCQVDIPGGVAFFPQDAGETAITVYNIAVSIEFTSGFFPKILVRSFDVQNNYVDDWFKYGKLTWLTGDNVGTSQEIAKYVDSNGDFQLRTPTPNQILIGDTFDVHAGCNKLNTTCIEKFHNIQHNGGFPFLPGNDRLILPTSGESQDL